MRYAVLADIHGNLEALRAVLVDLASRGGAEELWCLGDVVGYGPDPHECLALLREHPHLCVAGNHDWGAVGKVNLGDFNPGAAAACRWTAAQLTPDDREYLEGLPIRLSRGDFTLAHGSPRDPIWEYILTPWEATESFQHFDTPYCLIGHSHVPLLFEEVAEMGDARLGEFVPGKPVALGNRRLMVNPGSVGQPRDGDARASYAIYDSEARTLCHYRVPYDIAETQAKMRRQQLPLRLILRLSYGR